MLNKLTVLCFSPTGGTAKAAGFTASALAESVETVDLLRPVTPRTFTAEDTVLIAMPVFGGRIPAYALEQLRAFQGAHEQCDVLRPPHLVGPDPATGTLMTHCSSSTTPLPPLASR